MRNYVCWEFFAALICVISVHARNHFCVCLCYFFCMNVSVCMRVSVAVYGFVCLTFYVYFSMREWLCVCFCFVFYCVMNVMSVIYMSNLCDLFMYACACM